MSPKVALVTGGSRGIGKAICKALAAAGFHVIVASRSEASINAVVSELQDAGHTASALILDVGKIDTFKTHVKEVCAQFGGLHVLVNNAGITSDNLIARIKEADFDSVINTNLKGAFFLSQAVVRPMLKQRWGRIINISSVIGLRGNPGQTNYAASKAGVHGLTKALAREVATRGITVNAIAPGFIETEMTQKVSEKVKEAFISTIPAARYGQPEDVADLVTYLAGESAGYITGQVISVDGGLTA